MKKTTRQSIAVLTFSAIAISFVVRSRAQTATPTPVTNSSPAPVAFAVWDGQNRDRNGRKVVSNWHQLILDP